MINIKINSKKVTDGDTFVAIIGNTVDGHSFIEDAIKNGATTVVVSKDVEVPSNIQKIIVEDTNIWLEETLLSNYKDKVNQAKIIGITGTNGKTTTAYLTYQLLNALNKRTSYIGTIGYFNADKVKEELPNTTPNILDLYDLILTSLNNNEEYVVMEVSSQGLDMKRTLGLEFNTGLFTNLTQDHLDYHGDMNNYLNAKLKMLDQLNGTMIINADDDYSDSFIKKAKKHITFGTNGEIKIIDFKNTKLGTLITIEYNNNSYEIETNLKGEFNVYNYIGTLAIMLANGFKIENIIKATKNVYPPNGRCEQFVVRDGLAIIDYAHTPDAVEKIIKTFDNDQVNRIITVVGCGGDRDNKKRPIMGNIATTLSDYVVFTNDNPRTEDETKIMDDIIAGVNTSNYEIIYDRTDAINHALDLIEENDVVLILGKGHEDYQIIGKTKHHLDDHETILNYINKKNLTKEKKIF